MRRDGPLAPGRAVHLLRQLCGALGEAHAAGLAVIPYVVDDEPTMRHLVRLGVDGLITNRPDLLRGVLAQEDRGLPPSFARQTTSGGPEES